MVSQIQILRGTYYLIEFKTPILTKGIYKSHGRNCDSILLSHSSAVFGRIALAVL